MTIGNLKETYGSDKVIQYKDAVIVVGYEFGEYYYEIYAIQGVWETEPDIDVMLVEKVFDFNGIFYRTVGEALAFAITHIDHTKV